MKTIAKLAFSSAIIFLLVGCATPRKTLYEWHGYQNNLDAYFRGGQISLAEQADNMESDLRKIKTSDPPAPPPGYLAHLGLLYAQQGYVDKFVENMSIEKHNFPESTPFIDFLMRNFKQGGKRETN